MKIKHIFLSLIVSVFCVTGVNFVYASDTTGSAPKPDTAGSPSLQNSSIPSLENPLKAKNVQEVLYTVVDLAIFIGVIIAVLMFIFIGFKFVLAQGNDTKLKDAKMWFMYATIGTAVLISSKVIVEVIKTTFISAGVVNENLFKQ